MSLAGNGNSPEDVSYDPYEHLLEADGRLVVNAAKYGTTWRDPRGRSRGDAFSKPVESDTAATTRRDRGDGRATYFRGTGFYGGTWKTR